MSSYSSAPQALTVIFDPRSRSGTVENLFRRLLVLPKGAAGAGGMNVIGLSENPSGIMFTAHSETVALIMPGLPVVQSNRVTKVGYDNRHFAVAKGLRAIRRVHGSGSSGIPHTDLMILKSLRSLAVDDSLEALALELRSGNAGSAAHAALDSVRRLYGYRTHSRAQAESAVSSWLTHDFMPTVRSVGVRLKAQPVPEHVVGALLDKLTDSFASYSEEAEWVVNPDPDGYTRLRIPPGSIFVVNPGKLTGPESEALRLAGYFVTSPRDVGEAFVGSAAAKVASDIDGYRVSGPHGAPTGVWAGVDWLTQYGRR